MSSLDYYRPCHRCNANSSLGVYPHLNIIQTHSMTTQRTRSATVRDELLEKSRGKALSHYTTRMEFLWHGEFFKLFQFFTPHTWQLRPTFSFPKGPNWVMFKDTAKVRFLCKMCSHGWTSMRGGVAFWFMFDPNKSSGIILFRLFGQKCQVCTPALFEHAMWYPEEVIKVIGNLFNRVGQHYYGFYQPSIRVDRRRGRPSANHNSAFCQACCEGVCQVKRQKESSKGLPDLLADLSMED